MNVVIIIACLLNFFFQAEDGIRDLVRSRGLGDVYKRQELKFCKRRETSYSIYKLAKYLGKRVICTSDMYLPCLLYTSDAADERSSVDLGGRRIIKKKKKEQTDGQLVHRIKT